MIGESIKTEVPLEELRKITWDYSKEDFIGLYQGKIVRRFLWEVSECGEINPLAVTRCNVVEGWIEHIEYDESLCTNILHSKIALMENGEPVKTMVLCKVVVNILDDSGNIIVTLR